MEDLIVIGGATASGKSALAVTLAERLGGEVVSCDSMQLYRGLDIGTAKPTMEEMRGIPHHLIGILEPTETCSAARYRALALPILADIWARGRTPILCGGTGLYINALTRPLSFAQEGDERLRNALEQQALAPNGPQMLHERLRRIDPESAEKLHVNDVRRVIRALEIFELTGMTKSQKARQDAERDGDYRARLFAMSWARAALYARIDRRVDEMIEQGLPDEVRKLLSWRLPPGSTAMQAIGYKELIPAVLGQEPLSAGIERLKMRTRQYAKRQLTWFRADPRIIWLPTENKTIGDISREMEDQWS